MAEQRALVLGINAGISRRVAEMLEFLEFAVDSQTFETNGTLATGSERYSVIGAAVETPAELIRLRETFAAAPVGALLLLFISGSVPHTAYDSTGFDAVLPLPCTYRQLQEAVTQAPPASQPVPRRRQNATPQSLEGGSAAIRRVRELIEKVAHTDASVLILGESGTGKEIVARMIHRTSARSERPFVPVNCGAIPGELLESELFGHEKGAFTGAITARAGRFELADGGSLFLDEIGDMNFNMQVKLLRVLQERTYERVGSNRSLQADVRIIAATHQNLESSIADGKFREDLFYRLNVFPIEMPPLRARREDIPALVESMIGRMAPEKGAFRLDRYALEVLMDYPWPGNVRELANLIERLRILYPNMSVTAADLPDKYRGNRVATPSPDDPDEWAPETAAELDIGNGEFDLKNYLNDLELKYIRQALTKADGVVAQAAKLLNLRRTTLVEKMRKFQLEREELTF
ncbi:MAG: sigma-54 interaction domain-containing protein [Thiotrichales bacterium]